MAQLLPFILPVDLRLETKGLWWATLRRWKSLAWAILTLLVLRCVRALWRTMLRRYLRFLRLSSPLRGAGVKYASLAPQQTWYKSRWSGRWYCWHTFPYALAWPWPPWSCSWNAACPCCKRPLEIQLRGPPQAKTPATAAKGKYAYLICLWGSSLEYVVGAMVLGASIRNTKSKHDRVCLFTDDVPEEHLIRLSKLWKLRPISHISVAMDQLSFPDREERFAHVFTKLQGLGLTDYEKVLMMDIDLLVRRNIDDLFELPAPAALRRGMNDWGLNRHGEKVDGRSFLLGEDKSQPRWSWGQGTGINAGVMLWQPSQTMLTEMLAELSEPNHPEHVRGNGPEQDYLSRTWADAPWTYIGAQYNFQLHQMFFALHPDRAQYAERANLLDHPEEIKIVHYSGKPTAKPWHRVLDRQWKDFWPDRSRDQKYVELFAQEFMGYWLWILRDREKFDAQVEGNTWDLINLELGDDGEFYRRKGEDREHLPIPAQRARGAMTLLTSVLKEWFDIYETLEAEFRRFNWEWTSHRSRGPLTFGPSLPLKNTTWKRGSKRAWWMEAEKELKNVKSRSQGPLSKITVTCSVSSDGNAVCFRDSDNVFEEDGDVTGLYIKLYGQEVARNFDFNDLDSLHLWASTIPDKAIVLTALVGIEGDVTPMLQALGHLGVPQDVPPAQSKVLACVSMASVSHGPCANHASPDVAYASLLLDPASLA